MSSLRAGATGGDAAARRERLRTMRTELQDRISAVLDPAQQTKFADIVKRASAVAGQGQTGRVFTVGSDGKPQGITVRISATDGSMTEILAGIEAGRNVIIGGGPRATGTSGTQAGPRLF